MSREFELELSWSELEFSEFLSEVKVELEIIKIILFSSSQSGLIRIKQIEDAIRDGLVKKTRNPQKSFRHPKNPLYKHL